MVLYLTESKHGSDCSGSSGDSNRVLTLVNTQLTVQAGFLVYASGLLLSITDEYTVSHQDTSTQITFLNPLWDDMTLLVQYSRLEQTEYEERRTDFQDIINEHGVSMTLIRKTETTKGMGEVSSISEETWTVVVMIQDITKKDRQIHEMGLAIPGNSKAFFYHEYPNSITGSGTVVVQAGDILKKSDNRLWRIEQIVNERILQGEEIFRTGVIRNIDLDQ